MAVYRLNTFPFIHLNFFHAVMNILALTPLLERFETEYGTLTALALFFGRWFPFSSYAAGVLTMGSICDVAGVHLSFY